jgi:hypothetical protein
MTPKPGMSAEMVADLVLDYLEQRGLLQPQPQPLAEAA